MTSAENLYLILYIGPIGFLTGLIISGLLHWIQPD